MGSSIFRARLATLPGGGEFRVSGFHPCCHPCYSLLTDQETTSKQLVDHSAPDSSAGTIFQLGRALYWLATSGTSDALVGVETDDDVALREGGLLLISEQDKISMQTSGQPFQDRSKGLWNTLGIWLDAATDPAKREAQLHLVTNRPVPSGSLAAAIGSREKSDLDIKICIGKLRGAGVKPPATLSKLFASVLKCSDAELAQVIRRVQLNDRSAGAFSTDPSANIAAKLHIPDTVDHSRIIAGLLGWLQTTLMMLWGAKQPGWVSRQAFDRELDQLLRRAHADRARERAAHLIPVRDEERDAAGGRKFVELLREIDADEQDIYRAIENFIRFSTERFRLTTEGDLVEDDWSELFSHLCERWDSVKRRHHRNRDTSITDEMLGDQVFRETADAEHLAPLGGVSTCHYYFTRGAYQRLADERQVWWHPRHDDGKLLR